jgi:hypothetical protein
MTNPIDNLIAELRAEADRMAFTTDSLGGEVAKRQLADRLQSLADSMCSVALEACAEYADGTCLTHYKNLAFDRER